MNNFIIAIGNKARQGKDELAKVLHKQIPNSVILHFADALYEECYNRNERQSLIYKVADGYMCLQKENKYYYITGTTKNKKVKDAYNKLVEYEIVNASECYFKMEKKDSKLLQWWGTDFRRNLFGDDYWIKQIETSIKKYDKDTLIIIPDTRFLNEYNFTKDNDGIYINVQRYNKDGSRYIDSKRDAQHVSETELDSVNPDYILINDSTKENFKTRCIEVANRIKTIYKL